ncbi:MAG: N-acetylmuramoyl-L-alanine amidase [Opitutaceae bacterium]
MGFVRCLQWGLGLILTGLGGCTTARQAMPLPPAAPPPAQVGNEAGQRIRSDAVAARMGLTESWVIAESRLAMNGPAGSLEAEVGRRECIINGLRVFLGEPPLAEGGHLTFARSDVERQLLPILGGGGIEVPGPIRTIAVDAGHGGTDSGTKNAALGLQEKDLTLDVARRLEAALRHRGFAVIMTRTDDSYVPLKERPQRANGADLFLSIHFNATGNAAVSGTETYVLSKAGQASTGSELPYDGDEPAQPGNRWDGANAAFGFEVQRRLVRAFGTVDRGLKQARFVVLRDLSCPGILVESAFLTHPGEASRVSSPEFRAELAQMLAESVVAQAARLNPERS